MRCEREVRERALQEKNLVKFYFPLKNKKREQRTYIDTKQKEKKARRRKPLRGGLMWETRQLR